MSKELVEALKAFRAAGTLDSAGHFMWDLERLRAAHESSAAALARSEAPLNEDVVERVERVAEAIWRSDPRPPSEGMWPYHVNGITQETYRRRARAAIDAIGASHAR